MGNEDRSGGTSDALRQWTRGGRQELFRAAFEALPVPLVIVERTGRVVFVNMRSKRLFGYGPGELDGQSIDLLVPVRFRAGHASHREDFWADPRSRAMGAGRDLFGVRKDGSEFPVEIGLDPLQTDEGMLVLALIVDISERKAAEQRLRRTAADLARSNADLEVFAYTASHDLQEPLRMITSYLQLVEKRLAGQIDERTREFLGHAVQGARHMASLIDGLLAYSRAGTSGMQLERFPLERAVLQARQNLLAVMQTSGAELSFAELPEVRADFVLLVEVLQNLIGNALKFCTARPPRVAISAARQAEGWAVHVRDNGIGIDPTFAERIFGVFQRLHPRDHYPGSGIGLAICRKIVERHGGTIRLARSDGPGSEFVFTLPEGGEG